MTCPLLADLLPTPRECRFSRGALTISGRTRIWLPHGATPADARTAERLADLLKEHTGLRPRVAATTRYVNRHVIHLGPDDRFDVPADFVPHRHEGYGLRVAADGALIASIDSAGLFYGVETFGQMLRLRRRGGRSVPAVVIRDWPDLRHRAVMIDIARQVERPDYMEEYVRRIASYKKNMFVLYFEDKFRWRRHAGLSHPLGYTAGQMRRLAETAARHHVEFVPALASLGHCEGILQHERIAHLREDGAIYQLSLRHPGTRKLLAELYDEILPLYGGRYFHVNCDESPLLAGPPGSPPSYLRQSVRLFGEHLIFLHDLLARHGKQMMIWGDMLLHHRQIMADLPRDIIVVDWDYGSMADRRREAPRMFRDHGFPVIVAPASCRSAEVCFPPLMQLTDNVPHFIRQGIEAGAVGEMTTLWEMRSTNPIVGWPGVVASAQYAWNSKAVAPSQIARRVAAHLHGPEAARDAARAYADLSSDIFFDRYMDERNDPPIPGCRTYHLDSHEFVATDPFVYLTYRKETWPGRVIRQAARGIEAVAAARAKARWADDDLDVCQLAGMHQAMHGQQRQTINRVGQTVVRAERLRCGGKLKQAAALLDGAAAELAEMADFARALITGTVDVWQRTRHRDDPALEEIYLRRLRLTAQAAARTAGRLRRAAERLHRGRNTDLGCIVGGQAVLVFEVTNPSSTLIDIFTPEISVTGDGRRWTTVNAKGWFFLERQRYLTAVAAPGGRLPRRVRVHVRRTHIDPRSFPPAERLSVRAARTLTPGEMIGRPPAADIETPDWRLLWTPESSYTLRRGAGMVLEYTLTET